MPLRICLSMMTPLHLDRYLQIPQQLTGKQLYCLFWAQCQIQEGVFVGLVEVDLLSPSHSRFQRLQGHLISQEIPRGTITSLRESFYLSNWCQGECTFWRVDSVHWPDFVIAQTYTCLVFIPPYSYLWVYGKRNVCHLRSSRRVLVSWVMACVPCVLHEAIAWPYVIFCGEDSSLAPLSFFSDMIRYFLGTEHDYRNVRSNYSDSQPNLLGGSAPSPPFAPVHPEQSIRDNEHYHSRDGSYQSPEAPRELPQRPYPPPQTQAQEPKPPSPTRKSMFDFVSPFDALASSGSSHAKKPIPPPQPSDLPSGGEDTWTTASLTPDPKRKSVDNLMEQLTRGQGPPLQNTSPQYDSYLSDEYNQPEPVQPRAAPPPPLPPKPVQVASPHSSPRLHAQPQHRSQPRSVESPVSQQQGPTSNQRNKESSPAPSQRGNWKAEGKGKGTGAKGKLGK